MYIEYLVQTVSCIKCPLRNQADVDFVNLIMCLFVKCHYVVELWKDLKNWIHSNLGKLIKYSPIDIILGYLHRDNQLIPINTLIATTKYYISKVL